jgi:hypothetical protein
MDLSPCQLRRVGGRIGLKNKTTAEKGGLFKYYVYTSSICCEDKIGITVLYVTRNKLTEKGSKGTLALGKWG